MKQKKLGWKEKLFQKNETEKHKYFEKSFNEKMKEKNYENKRGSRFFAVTR